MLLPIVVGALISTLALVAEHLALWAVKLPLTARYTIGTATIGGGLTIACWLRGAWFGALAFWVIAGAGGVAVASLHFWRDRHAQHPRDIDDAFAAGQLAARARAGVRHGEAREYPDRRN